MKVYIIAAFWLSGWSFLMDNNKFSWFFEGGTKSYSRLSNAEKMARKVNAKYGFDKVCVFDVTDLESYSVSDVKDWAGRVMYEIDNRK